MFPVGQESCPGDSQEQPYGDGKLGYLYLKQGRNQSGALVGKCLDQNSSSTDSG